MSADAFELEADRCLPSRVAAHKELGRTLRRLECVEAVDYIGPEETPSGYPETEIVAEATRLDTLPNVVQLKILASGLGTHDAGVWQNPDYQHAIVR
jgi:hypothetical protein